MEAQKRDVERKRQKEEKRKKKEKQFENLHKQIKAMDIKIEN